jgi:hypothetical protein
VGRGSIAEAIDATINSESATSSFNQSLSTSQSSPVTAIISL